MYSMDSLKSQGMLVARDFAGLARQAPMQIRRLLKMAGDGELSIGVKTEDVIRLSESMERSSSRLAVSIIVAALLISSSILVFAQLGDKIFNVPASGLIGFMLAGLAAMYVVISIIRSRPW
jgi:ubiquinone biosynthesis protein